MNSSVENTPVCTSFEDEKKIHEQNQIKQEQTAALARDEDLSRTRANLQEASEKYAIEFEKLEKIHGYIQERSFAFVSSTPKLKDSEIVHAHQELDKLKKDHRDLLNTLKYWVDQKDLLAGVVFEMEKDPAVQLDRAFHDAHFKVFGPY